MADKNYVGYVKREADSFIDWASIGKNLSDTLINVRDSREQQKAQIQQQTDDLVKSINEAELGQDSTFNQKVLDGAAQSQQALLAAYKEFTSGRLKQPAYARFKQVLRDDWSQYNNAIKTYNQKYDEALKKVEDGTMAGWGEVAFQKDSDFLNYQKYNIYVNPTSGRLALAEVDQEGNIITDPSKMLSVNNITNIYSDQPEKFKIDAFTDKVVDKAKEFTKVRGNISIKDATASDEYKAYEKAEIDAIIENSPRDVASILTDFSGEKYDVIFDSKVYDGLSQSEKDRTILLERDGSNRYQPKMSDALKAKAEEVLKTRIRGKIDYVQKTDYPPRATKETATDIAVKDRDAQNKVLVESIYKVMSGDITEQATLANNPMFGLADFKYDPITSTVTYTTIDGTRKVPIKLTDKEGNPLTAKEATKAVVKNLGIRNINVDKVSQFLSGLDEGVLTSDVIDIQSGKGRLNLGEMEVVDPVTQKKTTVDASLASTEGKYKSELGFEFDKETAEGNRTYLNELSSILNTGLRKANRDFSIVLSLDENILDPKTESGFREKRKAGVNVPAFSPKAVATIEIDGQVIPLTTDLYTQGVSALLNEINKKIKTIETPSGQTTTGVNYSNL